MSDAYGRSAIKLIWNDTEGVLLIDDETKANKIYSKVNVNILKTDYTGEYTKWTDLAFWSRWLLKR